MLQLLMLSLGLAAPTFATTGEEKECHRALGSGDEFSPTEAHRQRLVRKIISTADRPDEKSWHGLGGGNQGLHAYLIPHAKASRFLDIVIHSYQGERLAGLREEYNPRTNILVGVLETEDEPRLSIVLLPKDDREELRRGVLKINPVDSADNAEMRKLVPDAWKGGDFNGHHLLWEMLKDGREVAFPGAENRWDWTIERYK